MGASTDQSGPLKACRAKSDPSLPLQLALVLAYPIPLSLCCLPACLPASASPCSLEAARRGFQLCKGAARQIPAAASDDCFPIRPLPNITCMSSRSLPWLTTAGATISRPQTPSNSARPRHEQGSRTFCSGLRAAERRAAWTSRITPPRLIRCPEADEYDARKRTMHLQTWQVLFSPSDKTPRLTQYVHHGMRNLYTAWGFSHSMKLARLRDPAGLVPLVDACSYRHQLSGSPT